MGMSHPCALSVLYAHAAVFAGTTALRTPCRMRSSQTERRRKICERHDKTQMKQKPYARCYREQRRELPDSGNGIRCFRESARPRAPRWREGITKPSELKIDRRPAQRSTRRRRHACGNEPGSSPAVQASVLCSVKSRVFCLHAAQKKVDGWRKSSCTF